MLDRSLRRRLALASAVILLAALAATFVAVYRGTGRELRRQVDRELRGDADAFARRGVSGETGGTVLASARRYVQAQPFRASVRLLYADVPGGGLATNEPEVLGVAHERGESAERQAGEDRQAQSLRRAAPGFSVVALADVGHVRLYTRRILRTGRRLATIGVGEPLRPVERAQSDVARTFLVAGALTLLTALLVAYLLAARLTRPLDRMAGVAAQVDAGDLSPRMSGPDARAEMRTLAHTFDRMLDRLESAFAQQREFVSDASHELRTPLTVIRGQLDVLDRQARPVADEVHRVHQLVQTELGRMERLIEDLLLLARAEQERFLRREPIAIVPYLSQLLEDAARTAERSFELGPVPAGVLDGDPDKLAQALRNLLANAIEHTQPGGVVALGAGVDAHHLRIEVEDDGPGVPTSERQRVFDRFHRTDASRSRRTGGTGLGLAIVRAVVRAHQGQVWIEARPRGGTRIVVELPGFRAHPVPVAAPGPLAPPPGS